MPTIFAMEMFSIPSTHFMLFEKLVELIWIITLIKN